MTLLDRFWHTYTTVDEETADRFSMDLGNQYAVEIHPPDSEDVPASVNRFVREIMEIQSKWFKTVNASPVVSMELRRPRPDRIRIVFACPTKRLERKIRLFLSNEIPGTGFDQGVSSLPLSPGDTIGGGLLRPGRPDYFPLNTDQERPVTGEVTSLMHRHSNPEVKYVVQILAQPLPGHPLWHRRWVRRAYKRVGYLNNEKPGGLPWINRPATRREKKQADLVEHKASQPLWKTCIRLLVINGGEHTRSLLKELTAGYAALESAISNQYLDLHTITPLRPRRLIDFAAAVHSQQFQGWAFPFRTSPDELGSIMAIPSGHQHNIQEARP